jgi:xylulokinase
VKKHGDQFIAVIDLGTTGNRSVLFDLQGNEITKAYREFPTITDELEQAEQNAEDWWQTTQHTMQKALTKAKINPKDILAISVVSQRATLVPLDKDGNSLARAITWMDGRISPSAKEHEAIVKQRTSLRRGLWIKDMQPKVFKKTSKFSTPDAFIYHRLTGKLASDYSNHTFGLLDLETFKLSDQIGDEIGLPVTMWPEVIPSGNIIGELTSEAAKQTGLSAGTPVVIGGGDQQCSVVGLGVLQPGGAKLTIGTGTFVVTPVDQITRDPMGVLFCHPHVLPNQWVLEGVIPGSGTILRWFRDQFGHIECAVAERLGRDPYDYIIDQAAQSPPGSKGIILFPFFIWSLGIMKGLGFQHSRADIARSILEAVAFTSRFLIDTMFSAGVSIEKLRVDGGGSRSAVWRQIQCDIINKPCEKTHVDEGTALGAAIIATVAMKLYPTIENGVTAMVHPTQIHTPNPATKDIYASQYSQFQTLIMNNLQEILRHV